MAMTRYQNGFVVNRQQIVPHEARLLSTSASEMPIKA